MDTQHIEASALNKDDVMVTRWSCTQVLLTAHDHDTGRAVQVTFDRNGVRELRDVLNTLVDEMAD